MPTRFPYAGTAALASNGYPSIPMQTETTAYLGRFTTAPSAAYRNALNQFIYECKRASAWTAVTDLWVFVADTQADALRNLISASRDATIGAGAPTFTANKGFSGLSAGNTVSMPFDTTGLTTATVRPLWAGRADTISTGAGPLMGTSGQGGAFDLSAVSSYMGISSWGVTGDLTANNSGVQGFCVGIASGGNPATANHISTSSVGNPASVAASPMVANLALQSRLTAYGHMTSATAAQMRSVVAALTSFLERLGSLQ